VSERIIPPGTPVFGVAFADGSCGCWTSYRTATREMASDCREIGLGIGAFLTVRMKSQTLFDVGQ
jgi:hypothetical protein